MSGLTPVKSKTIASPRVGESAFSMECELGECRQSAKLRDQGRLDDSDTCFRSIVTSSEHHYHVSNDDGKRTGTIVLGRVKLFHARDDLIDGESLLVDTAKLMPVSRLGGISYGRTTVAYETPRPVWESEKERDEVKEALKQGAAKAKV